MKWFSNLKINVKLLIGFIIVAIIAGGIGAIGAINITKVDNNDAKLYQKITVPLGKLVFLTESFFRGRSNARDLVISSTTSQITDYENRIRQREREVIENLNAVEASQFSSQSQAIINTFRQDIDQYNQIIEKVIQLAKENKDSEATAVLWGDAENKVKKAEANLQSLIDLNISLAKKTSENNAQVARQSRAVLIILIVVGMLFAIGLGVFIANMINKPIRKLVETADLVALGDVTVKLEATSNDETGMLMKAFEKMIENIHAQVLAVEKIAAGDLTVDVKVRSEKDLLGLKLKEMVAKNNEVLGNINGASEQVSAGAKQVSISSQTLSQGSTEQASSLEEITSSITEVAAQTKQNAVNANQANELAITAKDSATEGNQQMQNMLKAMEEINNSSANISKIIKVIDEIAFQTNILALNAAVEAARAGQYGKGFAVVAEEVRNLAARSADAAKETTAMIEDSIKSVAAGMKIANDTAGALNKIVESVTGATNLVAEIANASNQQASAITQINQGVEQVSQVTQSNTATAEESASASEELSSQAELLKNMVAQFKIRKNRVIDQWSGVSSDVLKALEEAAKKGIATPEYHSAIAQAPTAAAQSKVKISLNDNEFGKY